MVHILLHERGVINHFKNYYKNTVMKNNKVNIILPLLLISFYVTAQVKKDSAHSELPSIGNIETRELFKRQGKFYFYWGYNRDAYTNSDIHFWGDGYNFTIHNVMARDEPEHALSTYIKLNTFTVPEYNYRLGYYINDKTFISLGEDHMKYTIYKQPAFLTGTVTKDNNNGRNIGTYNNTEVLVGEGDGNTQGNGNAGPSVIDSLPKGFVSNFEHCDGLNYVNFELGRNEQLWISRNRKDALSVIGTIDAGLMVPDTDADVLGYPPKHNMETGKKAFHLAGYGFSGSFGLEFDFCKNFFVLTELKGGYTNLPDINTTTTGGKASQHFNFVQSMIVVGYSHSFIKQQ